MMRRSVLKGGKPAVRAVGKPYALVMAFDENFVVGAETLMHSVLRHNPWFRGDWVVVSDGLSEAARARLTSIYPARFQGLDPRLVDRIRSIAEKDARFKPKRRQTMFFSLQAFALTGYRRVVFLDSDMLCTGDLTGLFKDAPDFGAAADNLALDGIFRGMNPRWSPGTSLRSWRYGRELRFPFNAGVMTVSDRYLGPRVFGELLRDPYFDDPHRFWSSDGSADQFILNRHFGDLVEDIGFEHNWCFYMEDLMRAAYRCDSSKARIVHFAGAPKPWKVSFNDMPKALPWQDLPYYLAWHYARRSLEGDQSLSEAWMAYRSRGLDRAERTPWWPRFLGRWSRRWKTFRALYLGGQKGG